MLQDQNTVDYVAYVKAAFLAKGNPLVAQGQMAYMKHQFDFMGLKAPVWVAITKDLFRDIGMPQDIQETVRLCFENEYREMQYFGLELVQKNLKKQDPEFIDFIEELICTKSWWDTVDWIAKLAGLHLKAHPQLIASVTEKWISSDYFWLRRVAIIFQLSYKEQTNTALLFDYIRRTKHEKEFFIRKAQGWALRQYSRTNPTAVREFIEKEQITGLARREGLRLMQ